MIGNIIGALSSLAGGLLGRSAAKDAQQAQQAMAAQNIQLQKDFAQHGIQWRVDDANRAGIHPLYALGAQTHSFSPVSISGDADNSMATAVSAMGQDIGRAVNATRSSAQREAAETKSIADALSIERMGLQNEILKSDLASRQVRNQQQTNPPFPVEGTTPVDRSHTLVEGMTIRTPGSESTQDATSKEYGDEGLPQIPGQVRFARDWVKWLNRKLESDNLQFWDKRRKTMGRW